MADGWNRLACRGEPPPGRLRQQQQRQQRQQRRQRQCRLDNPVDELGLAGGRPEELTLCRRSDQRVQRLDARRRVDGADHRVTERSAGTRPRPSSRTTCSTHRISSPTSRPSTSRPARSSGRTNTTRPTIGPNGVTVADGTVYGATGDSAFALEAANGKQLWIKKLTRNANEGIDMAPGYNDNTVYVSTVPGNAKTFYAGNGQAVLTAMDASTGAIKWKWDEVPANLWSASTRTSTPAVASGIPDLRRPGQPVHRRLQPGPVHRHPEVSRGARAGPGRTSTPTRSSSSTRAPASSSGTTS